MLLNKTLTFYYCSVENKFQVFEIVIIKEVFHENEKN